MIRTHKLWSNQKLFFSSVWYFVMIPNAVASSGAERLTCLQFFVLKNVSFSIFKKKYNFGDPFDIEFRITVND